MGKHLFIILLFLLILSSCVHHKSERTYVGKNPNDPEAMLAAQRDRPRDADFLAGALVEMVTGQKLKDECEKNCPVTIKFECAENQTAPVRVPLRYKNVLIEVLDTESEGFSQALQTDQDGYVRFHVKEKNQISGKDITVVVGNKSYVKKFFNLNEVVLLELSACSRPGV